MNKYELLKHLDLLLLEVELEYKEIMEGWF